MITRHILEEVSRVALMEMRYFMRIPFQRIRMEGLATPHYNLTDDQWLISTTEALSLSPSSLEKFVYIKF